MSNIEKAIEDKAVEIEKQIDELEKKITKVLKQRKELVDCLRSVKGELVKGDVQLYKVTRMIDSALTKIAKGE